MNPNCLPIMYDAPPSLHELISRHFDETLPPAEHQRLTAALNGDFETRLDFVEAARLHARLEALAPALPPVKKRYVGRWVLAGAAAALMIGGGVLFWNQPLRDQIRITLQDMNAVPDGKPEKPKPTGLAQRVVKAPAAALGSIAQVVDMDEFLKRYYVDASPNGLTVPEALKLLGHSIKAANYFRRPELDQLTFFAGNPVHPNLPDPIIDTRATAPMSVLQFLNNCIVCRQVVQQPGGQIHGGPFPMVSPNQSRLEHFESGYQTALKLLSRMDTGKSEDEKRGYRAASERSTELVYLELITGPRSVLPPGFDENSGVVLSEHDFSVFLQNVKRLPSVRRTGEQSITTDGSNHNNVRESIDENDMFRQDDGLPEWGCFLNSSAATRLGELVCINGKITSLGWLAKHQVASRDQAAGEYQGTSEQGDEASKPTEYEVWLSPDSTALFVLDGPASEFVNIVCVTVRLIPSEQVRFPNPINVEKLIEVIEKVPDPRSESVTLDPWSAYFMKVEMERLRGGKMEVGLPSNARPGFLISPWAPNDGPVDVRGIPRGAEVKCPYTGKVFIVP